jgi:hypothetical protein
MNRLDKLKVLSERRAAKKRVEEENRQQFLEAIDSKQESLDESLGKELVVNSDTISEALKPLSDTAPAVERLVESMAELKERDNSILKALGNIADILQKNADRKPYTVEKSKDIDLKPVTDALSKVVESTKQKAPSQNPEDYLPYRRVRKDGNRLVFDDSYYNSGGGGGGGGISQVTNPDGSQIGRLSGLINFEYDYVSQAQAALTDTWVFKTGGAGGTTQGTVTITYSDATKNVISTVGLV